MARDVDENPKAAAEQLYEETGPPAWKGEGVSGPPSGKDAPVVTDDSDVSGKASGSVSQGTGPPSGKKPGEGRGQQGLGGGQWSPPVQDATPAQPGPGVGREAQEAHAQRTAPIISAEEATQLLENLESPEMSDTERRKELYEILAGLTPGDQGAEGIRDYVNSWLQQMDDAALPGGGGARTSAAGQAMRMQKMQQLGSGMRISQEKVAEEE
jgi:hypothetical protein|tara:strand:- start:1736 stop:2371 length:636 start_codon:yes stop_codon:yes gene_type:complete